MGDNPSKISVTLKGGAGYEAPWIVLYGDTPEELVEMIKGVKDAGLDLAVRIAAQAFQTVVTGSPLAAAEAHLETGLVDKPAGPPWPVGGDQQLPPGLNPPCKTCGGPTKFMT